MKIVNCVPHPMTIHTRGGVVILVVSALTALHAPERLDLYSPGPLIRDEQGRTIGCEGLRQYVAAIDSASK